MSTREAKRLQYLKNHGWGAALMTPLPADLSFRRYFRLQDGPRNALLMDSPPDKENIRPYVIMDRHLARLGFSVPTILELDEDQGLAIIEDFGDDTYTNLLKGGVDERVLYELAIDTLAALQSNSKAADIDVPAYNLDLLILEVMRYTEWFYPYYDAGQPVSDKKRHPAAEKDFEAAWRDVFAALPDYNPNIVLRDYHVDNLMILKEREGIARCGLLDFQDALIGHPAYDLTSLLEDARRDIAPDLRATLYKRYANLLPENAGDDFAQWYDVLSAQRHAKILAHFNRFHLRDNNDSKLIHIPRVMGLLQSKLDQPILIPVRQWFDAYMV